MVPVVGFEPTLHGFLVGAKGDDPISLWLTPESVSSADWDTRAYGTPQEIRTLTI